jgi:hypothetical protein
MKLGRTAARDAKNTVQNAPSAAEAPEPQAPAANATGAEKRRAKRQQIVGLNLLAPRTRIILDAEGRDVQPCRIRDVSDGGYRIATTHQRTIPIGTEITLEHTDGWRRPVQVRWALGNEFGLQIIGTNSYVILDGKTREVHECEILAVTENGYRITVAAKPKLTGIFLLELANGSRRKVRMRWSYQDEFGLELVDTTARGGLRG